MTEAQVRERRLETIREILGSQGVPNQDALVELLRDRGYSVTQSSVSRDLRDLRVAKIGGEYRLADGVESHESFPGRRFEGLLGSAPAGPYLLVLRTVTGGASRVALALDEAGWPEIIGTVAGDDTIFVATLGVREQKRLLERLKSYERNR